MGKKILARLRQDSYEPLAFTDNNPSLWGANIQGVQVLSPNEAVEKYGQEAAFIVTIWSPKSGHRFSLTKKKLVALNCKKVVSFVSLFWKYSDTFLPDMLMDLPHKVYEQKDEIIETFNILADNESQATFLTQLKWRIIADYDELPCASLQTQYFPKDLFYLSNHEVFIDCGAFDGDTLEIFLNKTKFLFDHFLAIEPDPLNFNKLNEVVQNQSKSISQKISLSQKAVGAKKDKLRFLSNGNDGSKLSKEGNIKVDIEPLSDILKHIEPTIIKMDIEGAEFDALMGAKDIISKSKPILAICVYHKQDHLWKLPKMMKSFTDEYQIFLRSHGNEGWETVCYAIPKHRLINILENKLRFFI